MLRSPLRSDRGWRRTPGARPGRRGAEASCDRLVLARSERNAPKARRQQGEPRRRALRPTGACRRLHFRTCPLPATMPPMGNHEGRNAPLPASGPRRNAREPRLARAAARQSSSWWNPGKYRGFNELNDPLRFHSAQHSPFLEGPRCPLPELAPDRRGGWLGEPGWGRPGAASISRGASIQVRSRFVSLQDLSQTSENVRQRALCRRAFQGRRFSPWRTQSPPRYARCSPPSRSPPQHLVHALFHRRDRRGRRVAPCRPPRPPR